MITKIIDMFDFSDKVCEVTHCDDPAPYVTHDEVADKLFMLCEFHSDNVVEGPSGQKKIFCPNCRCAFGMD